MPVAALMYVTLCTSPGHCEARDIVYKPNAASGREEQMRECEEARHNITLYHPDPTRTYVCEYKSKHVMATADAVKNNDAASKHHANVAAAD
ncbi:hypothetical protein [Pseudomonas sp. RIT-PI-S]|uniref:hypothetical protein n=1 Tax=Pseudomonas sp. RIT-PI-S TaxID=3035295 RepID=UPI0021DB73E1|nr:hypothetical protein [Pseudomonas sp. RIT-PI-S]